MTSMQDTTQFQTLEGTSAESTSYAIQVRGLHKSFGYHHVLRGIDLDVRRGETMVIIGGNQCVSYGNKID